MKDTPLRVKNEILQQEADIIILTEFLKTPNHYGILVRPLERCGYTVFMDPRPPKRQIRQVFIAIRKDIIDNSEPDQNALKWFPDNEDNLFEIKNAYPNFLRVDFSIENIPISVIGTRIRIDMHRYEKGLSEDEKQRRRAEEHLFRQTQLEHLLQWLPDDRNIIMLGDFNIDESYTDSKKKHWDYDKHYLPMLREAKLSKYAPKEGVSIGEYKFDHLILRESFTVEDIRYLPDTGIKDRPNYPDHNILVATVRLDNPQNGDEAFEGV